MPRHQVGTKVLSQRQSEEKKLEFDVITQKLSISCEEPHLMSEMMDLLGRSDRTKFRKRFIYPLIEKETLEMTIPNKPQSSNQRHVITKTGKNLC